MIFYKNTKGMIRSPDGDTSFLDIVTRIFPGDTWVPCLFILYLDYVLLMSVDLIKENDITHNKTPEAYDIPQKV